MVRTSHRKAFSMIELIFAIVIIGITVMSLPVMSRITQRGVEAGIIQEAIFAASSELMSASAGYWDVGSMDDEEFSYISRVIDVGSDCNSTLLSDRYRLRPGHITQPLHRRCIDANITTIAPSAGTSTTFPSLHNAAHIKQAIFTSNDTNATGYKQAYQSWLQVSSNAGSNIKDINITVYDRDGTNPLVLLRMRSANVGEIDFYKRRF